jgi:dipeptidyl aminopeptidase/acylaminoacyl peptidase
MRQLFHRAQDRLAAVVLAVLFAGATAFAQVGVVAPNVHLKADGIPPIPAALAAKVAPYTEFRPRTFASWHPEKREMIVATRATNTAQLFRIGGPLASPAQLTDFSDPVRFGVWWAPKPDTLVFTRDTGGNEQNQIYRRDPGGKEPLLLTDPARTHRTLSTNRARDRLLVASTDLDKTGRRENPALDLSLLDPLNPSEPRKIATLPGTGWFAANFSFDDRQIALIEYKSVNETFVWIVDAATGERRRVLPTGAEPATQRISTGNAEFTRDGKGLLVTTDRDGEFQRSAYLDLASGKLDYFGPDNWDTEELALSPDGKTIATITNEAGVGTLRLYAADTRRELPRPAVPIGTVRGAKWHDNSRLLAFNLDSAQSPGDVHAYDIETGKVLRWTESSVVEGLDPMAFQAPEPIEWKSFDGRSIGGFIVRPPRKFDGRRPVLIQIHGGPEAQARPGFIGRWNYYVNELGIAIIEPNVRGSTGYGKTFVALDNGVRREDSVRDIGALLDWIAKQPDLDPARVVVAGGSYGGYMSLAVATHYNDRIAGTIDNVGVANFVTFLERTESYRRDLRRVEYGDERDPAMREFLTKISPVNNAAKIRKPLFVAHGRNDPRVPYTEAEQIVETVRKNGVPVWYLLADNEGHGFARKENADFYFQVTIRFLQETVLK